MPRLFAEKLRALRLQSALTQVQVAKLLHIAANSRVSQLESGDAHGRAAPSLELIVRIAALFRVSTDYLLRDSIPNDPVQAPANDMCQDVLPLQPRLGATLRVLREHHSLTQNEAATRLAIANRSYIGNLEAGRKTPSPDLMIRIADLYGVSTDSLLCGEGGEPGA